MIKSDFEIRKANLSDAKQLGKLYVDFWKVHKEIDPLLQFKKRITLKNQVRSAKKDLKSKDSYVFVAQKDEKVVGLIELLLDENDSSYKVKKYGYINSAITHKNYRNQGVAKALTNHSIKFLRGKGIKYLRANVYNSNTTAMKAWTKLGFQPQSTMLFRKI